MSDDQFCRAFIDNVLAEYPRQDLMEPRNGVQVELVRNSVVRRTEDWQAEREYDTDGIWFGLVAVGDLSKWAVWRVRDSEYADMEAEDRGRSVTLFDTEAAATAYFVEYLIDTCDHFERPSPEDWTDDEREREWQTQRLADYIKTYVPYWRALTGFPEDIAEYCIRAQEDAREMWNLTHGHPTPEQVEGLRFLAALRG